MKKFFKPIVILILMLEARVLLRRHKPFIIAVTGSVGKTTTKDAIFHVLNGRVSIRKSEKSFNSEFGIPLTILGLSSAWHSPLRWSHALALGFWRAFFGRTYPHVLVLEIGADHPGDISKITKWLKPDIAVVTRLPERPVHVEFFSSPEDLRNEKWELVRALPKHGVCVVNGDDYYARELCAATDVRVITFGFNNDCHVRGEVPQVRYESASGLEIPLGITFAVDVGGEAYPVNLNNVLGVQPAMAALAALTVGVAMRESMSRMTKELETFETPRGRMRVIIGKRGSVIIDDTYNSSPIAAEAALETLRSLRGKQKIAILGDMLELGKFSEEEHRRIGEIAGASVDLLLTIGKRARWIAEGAVKAGLGREYIHEFTDVLHAGRWMAGRVAPGDVILAKGSQGSGANMIRIERAVKLLMMRHEDAAKLLVRQEDEWQKHYR